MEQRKHTEWWENLHPEKKQELIIKHEFVNPLNNAQILFIYGFYNGKKIDQIRRKCEENNLNIYTVFREANVPSATIQNWERKEPEAFEKLDKINKTIDKLILKQQVEESDEFIPFANRVSREI